MKKYIVKNSSLTDKFKVGDIITEVPLEEAGLIGLMLMMEGIPLEYAVIGKNDDGEIQVLPLEHVEEVA